MKENLILSFLIVLLFSSCDPESCRECGEFNYNLSEWSKMDDSIASELKFIDSNLIEYKFDLVSVEYSEPHIECAIASSPEGVGCYLTKRIFYSCDSLNLKFNIFYEQYEYLNDNPAYNDCNYLLEFINQNQHLITLPIDILHEGAKEYILKPLDKYTLANYEYSNVLKMKIEKMIIFDTYNTTDLIYIDAKYLKEVIFQIPNGIVGLTLENGNRLILINE